MLYPSSEIKHYRELSAYRELLYDDVTKSKEYEIQVVGHSKVKVPAETFIEYVVITEKLGTSERFKVHRRYSEFEWLMNYLYQKYPFQILPPMPPKRIVSTIDKFTRSFIDKRQLSLNAMMQRLRSFKKCIDDERTQIFLRKDQKEFDKYRSTHGNLSIFTKVRLSIEQLYVGAMMSIGHNDGWKDDNTVSYIKILNKTAVDRSFIMAILESIEVVSEHWEDYSRSQLLLAQDLSDVVLLMDKTELTTYIDGIAQLLFNLSTEGKLHCSFMTGTIQPIMSEYVSYDDHIIRTLKRRNRAQAAYYSKTKSIQILEAKIGSNDLSEMPKGNQFDELTQQSIMLEDRLKDFDDTFVPSLSLWQQQRSMDMARCLHVIVTSNLKYHRSCLDLCRHVLTKVQDDGYL